MFKSRVLLAGLFFSAAVYGGLDTACAATERVVEQAGDWKGVLLDESNLALTFSQDGVVIRIAPSASGDYIAMEAHVPATEAVSASFQAGKFALPLRRISTVDGATLFGAEIPRDTTRDFIHALTALPNGLLIWGENQKTISLSGTSSAVSGLDFYAHEHKLNLPAPFTTDSVSDAATTASEDEQSAIDPVGDVAGSEQRSLTVVQHNAVRSATNYLRMSGFSRAGLIRQLSSDAGDGYSVADATIAVDNLGVDWNENAVRSAKQYLKMSGFSCRGLIQQLSSSAGEQYTIKQATYGAHQAGACGEN